MRAREFLPETASAGATASGSVAMAAQPMGGMISRGQMPKPAKYANSLYSAKKRKSHVGR
jgi:hypothetical protein